MEKRLITHVLALLNASFALAEEAGVVQLLGEQVGRETMEDVIKAINEMEIACLPEDVPSEEESPIISTRE